MFDFDLSVFATGEAWAALITLTALEIVLGIDNIVFISIITNRLKGPEQVRARRLGLALALLSRLALLFTISWIMHLDEPLFAVAGRDFSARDIILGLGGLFLLAKATSEIFETMELGDEDDAKGRGAATFLSAIGQIVVFDLIFSLDSVITAVGMVDQIIVMSIAVVVAVLVMLVFVDPISSFIDRHPSMKVLALAFLVMIGVMLVIEALGEHVNKGYIYFAMAFSLVVELVNLRVRKRGGAGSVG